MGLAWDHIGLGVLIGLLAFPWLRKLLKWLKELLNWKLKGGDK